MQIYKIKNTRLKLESRIFHLHKIFYSACPLGNDIPYKFPCFHAGFYYESRQVWEEAKQALSAFNKILDEHEPKQLSGTEDDLLLKIISGLPSQTPYDSFFHELSRKTMEQEFIEYRKRNNI